MNGSNGNDVRGEEITIFTFLKGMTLEKRDFDFDDPIIKKAYSQRMIDKWISMNDMFLPLANEMNKCKNLDNKTHYEFYKNILPQQFIKFNYIKRKKEPNEHEKECVMKYYNITKRECDMYMEILSDKQVKDIVDVYKGHQ